MYPASDAFHQAVANNRPQKMLLIFSDRFFSNEDIDVERGVEFRDYFNLDENISIGQTPSNEISFTLFNDGRYLNSYEFGEFIATCGVRIGRKNYAMNEITRINTGSHTYRATMGRMYRDDRVMTMPAGFGDVRSILGYDRVSWNYTGGRWVVSHTKEVWCFGETKDKYAVFNDATGSQISGRTLNEFMKNKTSGWDSVGYYFDELHRTLKIWKGGILETYEFVPFGSFTAERPKAPDVIEIDLNCNDFMVKFDQDMPGAAELGITYPVTIGALFEKMCQYVGVRWYNSLFLNNDAEISAEPEEFRDATMRQVLQWIAEAAGSIARFDRDGVLEMQWLRQTEQTYTASGYVEFNPCWYQTKKITKLYNRNTQGGSDLTVGTGKEGYLIQDNPLLKGVS